MYCPRCGAPNDQAARFCGKCGEPLPASIPVAPPPPAPFAFGAQPRVMPSIAQDKNAFYAVLLAFLGGALVVVSWFLPWSTVRGYGASSGANAFDMIRGFFDVARLLFNMAGQYGSFTGSNTGNVILAGIVFIIVCLVLIAILALGFLIMYTSVRLLGLRNPLRVPTALDRSILRGTIWSMGVRSIIGLVLLALLYLGFTSLLPKEYMSLIGGLLSFGIGFVLTAVTFLVVLVLSLVFRAKV